MKMNSYGKNKRLARFRSDENGRSFLLALSHGQLTGPQEGLTGRERRREMIRVAMDAGIHGLLLTPGEIEETQDFLNVRHGPGIFLTAGWTNLWRSPAAKDLHHNYATGAYRNLYGPDTALELGADGSHVYLLMGDADPRAEADEVERIARHIDACHRVGLPVLVECIIRGANIRGKEQAAENVHMISRIAAEIGADMLKVQYPGTTEALKVIVDDLSIPVLVLGGAYRPLGENMNEAESALAAGATGLVHGRNVFQAEDPRKVLDEIMSLIIKSELEKCK